MFVNFIQIAICNKIIMSVITGLKFENTLRTLEKYYNTEFYNLTKIEFILLSSETAKEMIPTTSCSIKRIKFQILLALLIF